MTFAVEIKTDNPEVAEWITTAFADGGKAIEKLLDKGPVPVDNEERWEYKADVYREAIAALYAAYDEMITQVNESLQEEDNE